MKKIAHVFIVFLIFVSWLKAADSSAPMSLSKAVSMVLARHPALQAHSSQSSAAQAGVREATGTRWPQLGLKADYTRGNDPVYAFGSLLRQDRFTTANFSIPSLNNPDPLSNFSHGIEVGVPLFTAFELESHKKNALVGYEQSQHRLQAMAQQLQRQTLWVVLQALWKREEAALLKARLISAQVELASAEKLNKRGLVLGSDYEAARAIYSSLELRLLQAERSYEGAMESLSVMMSLAPQRVDVEGRLRDIAPPFEPFESYEQQIFLRRAEVREVDAGVVAAASFKKQSALSLLPRVDAFGVWEAHSPDFLSGSPQYLYGVRARVPIGDPNYAARHSRARHTWNSSQHMSAALRQSVHLELVNAYKRHQTARDSLPLAKATVSRALRALESFRPLYREGRQSILDVLQAEEGLVLAQMAELETLYHLHDSYAELLWAAGLLEEDLIKQMDARLTEVRP